MSHTARIIAFLICTITSLSLFGQGLHSWLMGEFGGLAGVVWRMAGYFTIWTNLLIALHFAAIAAGRSLTASRHGGLLSAIAMVGVIYHLILAGDVPFTGIGWWADKGLHDVVPVLVALWWLAFAPKVPLDLRDPALWLIWPGIYAVYAILRGNLTGFWPYPFLDVSQLGAAMVAVNTAKMVLAFLLLGGAILAVARVSR